jgi:hypothetical protein
MWKVPTSPLRGDRYSDVHFTRFFINIVLDNHLSSTQPQSFLKWTHTHFEKSQAEFYTILLEEHLQVALEMLEVGTSSPLSSPKLTKVVQ